MEPKLDPLKLINEQIQRFIEDGDIASAYTFEQARVAKGGHPISVKTEIELKKFITTDEKLLALKEDVRILAFNDDPVLITGESGTGKELIANALHGRRQGNFRAINCAAIPDTLLESELFGYKKGAFTGADNDKSGLFLEANNGTIFLDEIGEMPLSLQAKLLRVIQEKRIRPLGWMGKDIGIETRIVCATNKNLQELSSKKEFRPDLYYRLAVFELHIPPLRDRNKADIEAICKSLVGGAEYWEVKHDELCDMLLNGNVRELESLVKRYKVLKRS